MSTTLIEEFRDVTRTRVADADTASPAREGLTGWDFDALPLEHHFRQAGVSIFPTRPSSTGDSVDIVLHDYPGDAHARAASRARPAAHAGTSPCSAIFANALCAGMRLRFSSRHWNSTATPCSMACCRPWSSKLRGLASATAVIAAFEAARQRLGRQVGSAANDAERWLTRPWRPWRGVPPPGGASRTLSGGARRPPGAARSAARQRGLSVARLRSTAPLSALWPGDADAGRAPAGELPPRPGTPGGADGS
jgi:hypothetical protein